MINHLIVIILIIIIIYLFFKFYIKTKYPFWTLQPAFHIYDLLYWIYSPGIIDQNVPIYNKYVNSENILTYNIDKMSESLKNISWKFVKNNYFDSNIDYLIDKKTFFDFFKELDCNSYLSLYYINDDYYENNLISVITTRPFNLTIRNKEIKTFYGDFFCIKKDYRNKNIAQEVLQTHIYHHAYNHKDRIIGFMTRQTSKLKSIVPVLSVKSKYFQINSTDLIKSSENINILKITEKTLNIFTDFIFKNKESYDLFGTVPNENLLLLINNKVYLIYVIIERTL